MSCSFSNVQINEKNDIPNEKKKFESLFQNGEIFNFVEFLAASFSFRLF